MHIIKKLSYVIAICLIVSALSYTVYADTGFTGFDQVTNAEKFAAGIEVSDEISSMLAMEALANLDEDIYYKTINVMEIISVCRETKLLQSPG